jgi:rare lipoprotein A
VTNLWNGRSTVVRINDRGPFHGNRVIDLAHGAAHELGVVASGVASVKLEVLQ